MCLAEFERFAIPNMFLEGTIRKSRRGDYNLPRDTYHVLTTCIAVVSTNKQNSLLSLSSGCHKDDTHKSGLNTGAWFKSEKNQSHRLGWKSSPDPWKWYIYLHKNRRNFHLWCMFQPFIC